MLLEATDDGDIVEELYRGAADASALTAALGRAVTRAGASGGNIHVVDKDALSSVMFVPFGPRYEPKNVEAYFRYWRHINIHRAAMRRTRGIFLCHEHLGDEVLAHAPYAQDFYFAIGERYLAGAVAHSDPKFEVSLVFNRPEAAGQFGADTRRFISELLPHVRRASALAVSGAYRDALSAGLGQGLSAAQNPVWLIDGNLKVFWANEAGEELLRQGASLRGRDGRLSVVDGDAHARFAASVGVASARKLESAGARSLQIIREGKGALELEVLPATIPEGALMGATSLVMVMGRTVGLKADAGEKLRRQFGLTATEARLAVGVARGDELEVFAEAHGVTYETVRTQLRSVYMKTGTTRQAELAALVWTLGS